MFYADGRDAPTIWKAPIDGGQAIHVLDDAVAGMSLWTLWRNSLVYLRRGGDGTYLLEQFDIEARKTSRRASLKPERGLGAGITVSQDGEWVLVSFGEPQTGDIYLVESVP